MSPPTSTSKPSPPVVQTILESFTRCFNPLEPCARAPRRASRASATPPPAPPPPSGSSHLFGANIDADEVRAVSRSHSSSASGRGARTAPAPTASAPCRPRPTPPSARDLAERSRKRKLEIFRGAGGSAAAVGPRPTPPTAGPGSLALSDDEEELLRRAGSTSRRRYACGMDVDPRRRMSGVARLFHQGLSEAQRGLCFARPVRTACHEDAASLPDAALTDAEFRQRHADPSSEEETISSTLYFDQKYCHVAQTRPPMPLFQEHMLGCDDDGLAGLAWADRSSRDGKPHQPPVALVTSRPPPQAGGSMGGGGAPARISMEGLSVTAAEI